MFDPIENMKSAIATFDQGHKLEVDTWVPEKKPLWLYDFCVDICGHTDLSPMPHYEFINFLEPHIGDCQFRDTKKRKALLVEMPRGNFKTTIAGEDMPVGIITKNPNVRILITTHKDKASRKRLNAIKKHFENNAKFAKVFGDDWKPEFREGVWSSNAIEVSRRTKALREPTVEAGAVGADMTGSHYDVIIADDLVQKENVRSPDQRDKVHEYITSLFSLLDPGGILIVIGTRWHPDDAYGRIIANDEEREKAGHDPLFIKYIRSCYDGPNGLYFPTEYGHEELEELKLRMTAADFAANYLNKPVADADIVFKPEYETTKEFDYYFQQQRRGGIIRYEDALIPVDVIMAWDTAGSRQSSKSDFHGITVRGSDAQARDWALVAEEYKGTVSQVVSRIVAHISAFRPRVLVIEAVGSFEHWQAALQDQLDRYGLNVTIIESQHRGIPKVERIAMLEPKWSSRKIITKKDQVAFLRQISNFSMSNNLDHDDVLDSWAMGEGYADVPDDVEYTEFYNPIDEEYQKRQQRNSPQGIQALLRAMRLRR